jgi:hypothetical protein
MNCADIKIIGSKTGKTIKGKALFIANLPGYPTVQPPANNDPKSSEVEKYQVETS